MSSILPFSNFIIRTPLYPINTVLEDLNLDKLRILCKSSIIQEAIYLASKPLFSEMIKFCKDDDFKDEKVILSLLKYITRLSTRCTPFGLFSGCTIGSLSNETRLNRIPLSIQRKTTIDNLLLGELIMKYEVGNKNKILYYPNNSKYLVGNQLRYTEYRYESNSKLHFLSAVENTDVLNNVFDFCCEGRKMTEIVVFIYQLINDDEEDEVTKQDVENYVFELINNQILVSNLSPIVVGKKNTLEHLIDEINIGGPFRNLLDEIKTTLNKIDICLNEEEQMYHYTSLEDKIKSYEKTDKNRNYTFQSDILIDFNNATIAYEEYRTNLSDALKILNRLSNDYTVDKMKSFKERFYQKYEDKMVPLAVALDTENGIKYSEGKDYDLSGFLDDIKGFVGYRSYNADEIRLNKAERFLLRKIFKRDSDVVEIALKDVENFSESWDNVADTFSIVCSMHKDVVSLNSVGGNSASCLLGRFGYLDSGIENLINEIYLHEERTDKITAEIVHLPEDRTGNILYRYNTRKYEIPYLGLSSKNSENQILIDDLLVYIENDEVRIRSKKLNKEIIPKLSNAHNFSSPQSIPVYQFLCDLQIHNVKLGMSLNVSTILGFLRYTPRIQYKNIILSEQQWLFDKNEITELSKKNNFQAFLESKNIKKNFYLTDSDNLLYVNISNELSIKMFIQTVKNREHIILKESLYDEFSSKVVDDNECCYANEVILSYYKIKDAGKGAK